jgi:hypothetical protein
MSKRSKVVSIKVREEHYEQLKEMVLKMRGALESNQRIEDSYKIFVGALEFERKKRQRLALGEMGVVDTKPYDVWNT